MDAWISSNTALFVVVLITAELLVLLGLMLLLSRLSGWKLLADAYALQRPWEGEKLWMNWGRLRWVGYNGCLVLGQDAGGIYLHVWPIFNLGHAPLYIPRQDLSIAQKKSLGWSYADISIAKAPSVPFALSARSAKKLGLWG